jgi:hypothetical protein
MRQPAREEVVNRADRYAQARGDLPFVLVVRRYRLAFSTFRILIYAHIAFRAGEFISLRRGNMRLQCAGI